MKNIVILDAFAANPGDLAWSDLESLGKLTVHPRTMESEIADRLKDAHIVLTNKTPITKEMISSLDHLEYIGMLATGYNVVDDLAAREKGIPLCNVPAYSSESVAQHVFAHILNYCRRVEYYSEQVLRGVWSNNDDWSYWDFPQIELTGKTLSIVGLGRIGTAVAQIGVAMGMRVLAVNRRKIDPLPDGVEQVDLEMAFKEADFISLNAPLNDGTENIINKESLAIMKKSVFITNAGRGQMIVEKDLAHALNQGLIGGAGLDVLRQEPPEADHVLFSAKNCYITPHQAWSSLTARRRLIRVATENVRSFLEEKPQNVVNSLA